MLNCNRTIGRAYIFAAITLGVLMSATSFAGAAEEVNIIDGAALYGYDVFAYFMKSKPVLGKPSFTAKYENATYRFSSANNRDMFAAKPPLTPRPL